MKTIVPAALIVLLVTGCARTAPIERTISATPHAESSSTNRLIQARKSHTQAVELQIAESIPGHAKVRQSETGALSLAPEATANGSEGRMSSCMETLTWQQSSRRCASNGALVIGIK